MKNSLGERIRNAREKKGLSQTELARLCDVKSYTVISNWENDANRPDVEKLTKMCVALDVSPEVLLDIHPEGTTVISDDEKKLVNDYRGLDESGKAAVRDEINRQISIAAHWEQGYHAVTLLQIDKPIWLRKEDNDYQEMRVKQRELKKLREKSYKDIEEITKFLWSVGYTSEITRASVFGAIELGTRVPNRQLFSRIKAFLEGQYRIVIEGEN